VTPSDPYQSFARPDPDSIVSFREIGTTLYATVNAEVLSTVETNVLGDAFRERLAAAGEGGIRHVVADVERVTMMNSQAFSMLLSTHSDAQSRGARLILSGVTAGVMEMLESTRMTSILTVCRTPEELEAALA
jgi:anti-anti-sigma factor